MKPKKFEDDEDYEESLFDEANWPRVQKTQEGEALNEEEEDEDFVTF